MDRQNWITPDKKLWEMHLLNTYLTRYYLLHCSRYFESFRISVSGFAASHALAHGVLIKDLCLREKKYIYLTLRSFSNFTIKILLSRIVQCEPCLQFQCYKMDTSHSCLCTLCTFDLFSPSQMLHTLNVYTDNNPCDDTCNYS